MSTVPSNAPPFARAYRIDTRLPSGEVTFGPFICVGVFTKQIPDQDGTVELCYLMANIEDEGHCITGKLDAPAKGVWTISDDRFEDGRFWRFEILTLQGLEDMKQHVYGADELLKALQSDADLQAFYLAEYLPEEDEWPPMAAGVKRHQLPESASPPPSFALMEVKDLFEAAIKKGSGSGFSS